MSGYSRALIGRWGALLAELATLTGRTEPFAIGFIFSEETEAEYERQADLSSRQVASKQALDNALANRDAARRI